ncbi:MAG: hypothetical protein AB1898_31680 [Acidobacteriota bacterium]
MQSKICCVLGPALGLLLIAGCSPDVVITHSPAVARSSEAVTFNAELTKDGSAPCTVEIFVNGLLAQTCEGLLEGDVCTFTSDAGEYAHLQDWYVHYYARATNSAGSTRTIGYQFGVTDNSYNYHPLGFDFSWIPARMTGSDHERTDVVFHRAADYGTFETFVDNVTDKINGVYGRQALIRERYHFDRFNHYVYRKTAASAGDCGLVHADADADMSWREIDAVLHVTDFGDCTRGSHFSAEGRATKAFLHESGHAIYDLADEYDDDDCSTGGYFQRENEPNIFDTEEACRAEQTAKGRDPNACWQFTGCRGGWWGIHDLDVDTVMQNGNVGEPWGIEAEEHISWYYSQP